LVGRIMEEKRRMVQVRTVNITGRGDLRAMEKLYNIFETFF
jgi:hypothetical protein